MRLIPAILTGDIDDYLHKLRLAETFTDYAQIDFMDGIFVPSVSVSADRVAAFGTSLTLDAHLMVKDPLPYARSLEGTSFSRAFFHFEAVTDHRLVIDQIRALRMRVGIAVNPHTEIEAFSGLLEELDSVLFLTVDPGFYGSPFQPRVLKKIKRFRSAHREKEIGIDGGVKLDNLAGVLAVVPDFICVGSAIFHTPNPELAYKEFLKRIETETVN